MRISILSMQRVVNFGSVLQAYSLRQILRELTDGEISFLDIEQESSLPCNRTVQESADYETPAEYPSGILQKGKRWLITRLSRHNKNLIRKFMAQELKLDGKANQETWDHVIVGSDEVLNHARGVCLQLHGNVKQAKNRITYAAACGSARAEDIAPDDVEAVRQAMANFSAVSVRDEATRQYVSQLYSGQIHHHLDPVLVGNLNQRQHKKVPIKKYLLVYAYGQRIRTAQEIRAIQEFARKKKLKTVAIGGSQFWCDRYIPADPMRMLDYFYYADYVVTDTFHGAVFSVINGKQFAVIMRKTNRNKLLGLLRDLNLEDRLLENMEQLESTLTQPVDYAAVNQVLAREKTRTRAYLKEQLGV